MNSVSVQVCHKELFYLQLSLVYSSMTYQHIAKKTSSTPYFLLMIWFIITFIKKNPKAASVQINNHLEKIQKWLNRWRLKMAPHKCSYLVFTNSNANLSDELNLNLNGSKLKYDNNPTFLGIRFDNRLTFKNQVEYLKETCIQRLNILKILAHKSWMLTVKTLLQIYNVLIRSIIDYSSIIAPIISATNLNVLQIIQNKSLRIIYKNSLFSRTSNEWLHEQASLCTIKDRLKLLRKRYIRKAIANNNPIIIPVINEYLMFSGGRNLSMNTILCDLRKIQRYVQVQH